MPRNVERDARELARRKQRIAEIAFPIFAEKSIESVPMTEIAKACEFSDMTLYRHFATKDDLVVAAATRAFTSFLTANRRRNPQKSGGTAADVYAFFLDSFLRLYRERRDLLRFNQFFNVYVQSHNVSTEQMEPYTGMIDDLKQRFHTVYLKGEQDGTLRTDVPENEMFSMTLHLMLAVVTRYAVGLVYDTGIDPEQELLAQKKMLLARHTNTA